MSGVKDKMVIVIKMRRKLLTLILVTSVVCMSCLYVHHSFSALSESSYVVAKIGNFWVAQNGTSGAIEFNTTDASTTIQSCIFNLTSNLVGSEGGRILLRSGSYFLTAPLIIPRPDITIEGEGWRATGLVANFSGDIIRIYSSNDTPYTHCVRIKNMLFYNANSNLNQTAIYLNVKDQLKLWYVDLEELYIIGMNGIRTDHVSFGTNTNVLQGWIIRDVFIENAPQFGIDLWATIDMTIDNVEVNFAQNNETYPVDNTAGIEITLSGESSGIYITNTRVLRAEWGITVTGVRDIWMTNVISDICKTWAFKLDNTINCILTNIYAHSPNGTGILIAGNGSQNRIVGATVKDSLVGVEDDTPWNCPQYFDSVISESILSNSINWQVKQNDTFTNCNYGLSLDYLQAEFNSLNVTVINLNQLVADLQRQLGLTNSTLQALSNQVNTLQETMYVLAALIVVIIVAAVYLETRKPKTKKSQVAEIAI